MNASLLAVELFAGAGGLSIGLEQAGFQILLANELEKDFAATFAHNHPSTKVLCQDIQTIDFVGELGSLGSPAITLLSGGPPCQGFSTVGAKREDDPRNRLLYEYLRAVQEIRPMYLIFENVAGFARMYEGQAYRALQQGLQALGYDFVSGILEASDYGLPQKRQRSITLGWQKGLPPVRLPAPTHGEATDFFSHLQPRRTLQTAISDLPPLGANDAAYAYTSSAQNAYQQALRGDCEVLTEHNSANYGEKMRQILALIPPGGTVDDLPAVLRPKAYFSNTYARLWADRPTPTITRNFGTPSSSRCVHPTQNRALSTREGARLQGFPDSYQFMGSKISKNLQIGNAVPPIFGFVLAQEIVRALGQIHLNETSLEALAL
jgi:DNA (cytosine-5)-methyltransferase 1